MTYALLKRRDVTPIDAAALGLVYYNEFDDHAASWIENLIRQGDIAYGIVDRRDIRDIEPADLDGFVQCHFFAGVGVWSYALRRAGWRDNRPVWTGSCPCQPFSSAGRGVGFDDERHLWPAFHWLIDQCRPDVVIGEQVASKVGLSWIDLVSTDLEGSGYACGTADTCAAGVGSPNIRQRQYWMAHAESVGRAGRSHDRNGGRGQLTSGQGCATGRLDRAGVAQGDAFGPRLEGHGRHGDDRDQPGWIGADAARSVGASGSIGGLGNATEQSCERDAGSISSPQGSEHGAWVAIDGSCAFRPEHAGASSDDVDHGGRPGPVNGLWRNADWLGCTDGKWRPVEPGTQPLVDGAAFKLGSSGAFEGRSRAKMLKGYGNAINAEQAVMFIEACMEVLA